MFEIEFYTLPDGKKPVEEFLDSLPAKMRIKAIDRGKDGAIREAELLIKELGLKSDR